MNHTTRQPFIFVFAIATMLLLGSFEKIEPLQPMSLSSFPNLKGKVKSQTTVTTHYDNRGNASGSPDKLVCEFDINGNTTGYGSDQIALTYIGDNIVQALHSDKNIDRYYYQNNKVIRCVQINPFANDSTVWKYEYDSKGNIVKEYRIVVSRRIVVETNYSYTSEGKLNTIQTDGRTIKSYTHSGDEESHVNENNPFPNIEICKYDKFNNRVHYKSLDNNRNVISDVTKKYDLKNEVVSMESTYKGVTTKHTFKNTYDSQSNLIKQIGYLNGVLSFQKDIAIIYY